MKIKNKFLSFLGSTLFAFSVLFGVSALLDYSSDNKTQVHAATENPDTMEFEVLNVTIDTEKLGKPYPGAVLYNSDKYIITTNDSTDITLADNRNGKYGLIYGNNPLSEWNWSANPLNTNSIAGNFTLGDGVYAGYLATFHSYNSGNDRYRYFTENTEVNVVDKDGNPITEGVYTIFFEEGYNKYISVVYDLGLCKLETVDVTSVDFTVENAEELNKYTKLYPGDSNYSIGIDTVRAESLFYLTGSSANQQDLVDDIKYSFKGYYSTNEDPSTITSISSWSPYQNTYFSAGEKLALVYEYRLSYKKYDFNENMEVNLLDENGEPFEGVNAYAFPYYYEGTRQANYFYLVVYADEVKYAGTINELNFDTEEGIEWPTKLNPGATLKESFPTIAERYSYDNYTVITSSNSEVKKIYQEPGYAGFNVNNVDAYIGIGYYYSKDSDGNNIYSIYDVEDFESSYDRLVNDTEYVFGFVIQLEPGYRLANDVKLPENYKIVYSLVDELNMGNPGSYYGYSRYGSSQYYFIVYTIGTASYEKVTQLGVSFNESLLSNVTLESGAYRNKVGNTQIPNYEFVTFNNKEGYLTSYDSFLQYVNERFGGSIDAYWEYLDAEYLEDFGTEYPEELKYISNGYWVEKTNYGWDEPELEYNYNDGSYEFALKAGKTYGFAYSLQTKPGFAFDLDSISAELNSAGFELVSLSENYLTFVYEVGTVQEKVIDHIDFDYSEEHEILEEQIVTGGLIPNFFDEDSALMVPTQDYYSVIGGFNIGVAYSDQDTFSFESISGVLNPGNKIPYNKYLYYFAFVGLNEGYIFSPSLTHNLVEEGYTIHFPPQFERGSNYYCAYLVKKIGYATGTTISSGTISADNTFKPVIDVPVSSVTLDSLTLSPSDKLEIYADEDSMIYYKAPNKTYWSYTNSNDVFIKDYNYRYDFFIRAKEGYAFTPDFVLEGLPEGSEYYVANDGVTINVQYYLGQSKEAPIEFTYDEDYEPTIDELALGKTIPQYVDYEAGKGFIFPAQNSETKVDGNIGIVVHDTKTPIDVTEGEFLRPGSVSQYPGHVFATGFFEPGYGVTFTEDMEIIGIPDGYSYDVVLDDTLNGPHIVIYKYLGEIGYDFINQVDVSVSQDFINSYLAFENLTIEDLENAFVINDQNAKYITGVVNFKYYNPTTQELEFVNLQEPLSPAYTYYITICLITGDESNIDEHYNYRFTLDVENKTEGSSIEPVWGDDKGNLTVIELAIELPALELEDLSQAEITLGDSLTYNGQIQTQEISVIYQDKELVEGTDYVVSGHKNTNAGTYTITITGTGSFEGTKTIEYSIAKASHNMSGISFNDVTVTYDGNEHEVVLDGTLPSGVEVSYSTNKGTNVGTYNAVATFTYDTANYNVIADMNAVLTINKATHDMSGISFNNVTVTYDGNEHEVVLDGILPTGVEVTYTTNKGTNTGTYNAVATFTYDTVNYNIIADMSAVLTINKATHNMSGITFNNVTVTYDGNEHEVVLDGILPTGVEVSYLTNKGNNAGTYNAVATFTYDTANYNVIENKTATLIINKATHNMSGISFNDVTETYDGKEHVVEITGTLPSGVTVTYENNKGTNAGVYNAVAKFVYDTVNYNAISSMEATLVIKQVELKNESDLEEGRENDVIVSAPEGIDPTKELFVELVELEETDKDLSAFLEKGERVAVAYDVKLLKDGIEVQPDGTLKIKILIPQELRNRNFSVMHVHNDTEKTMLEYQIDGDYVVVETDKLSEFAFVYKTGSILWLVIVLGVLTLLEGGLLVYLLNLRKKQKLNKVKSVYPPFIFGMFIPAWQIVMVVILIIAVAVLAVIDVLLAVSLIKGKQKEVKKETKEEPVVEEKDTEEDDEIIKLWNKETQSYTIIRIIKSFEARLSQSNEEIKDYYDNIKNELLSYKNVKSKISFKHEAFKVGKNCVARLKYRGKTLCLYLALDPKAYESTKYKVEDMSEISYSSEVPTMYRIHLPRRVNYAKELIKDVMTKFGGVKNEVDFVNYSTNYPHQTNEELIEKGLIKKLVKEVKN